VTRITLLALAVLPLTVAAAQGSSSRTELISFWSDRAGLPGVWVMTPSGSARRLLTGTRSRAKRGDFAPDAHRIAFDGQPVTGGVFDFDIQLVRIDGQGRRGLTRGRARDVEARWAPAGGTIAFQRQYGEFGAPSIWTVEPSGRNLRRLASGSSPIWSPDGESLLFSRTGSSSTGADVFRMKRDGSGARLVFRSRDDDFPSAWSPDGRRILITRLSRRAARASVWVLRADGGGARRLTHGNYDLAADFSPDGRKILFTRISRSANNERGQVYIAMVDGSNATNLSRNRADENATSWAR